MTYLPNIYSNNKFKTLTKIIFYLSLIIILILAVLPANKIPTAFNFWDKAQHFLAFAVLTLLGLIAYIGFKMQKYHTKILINLITGIIIYGAIIELIQTFLPWRSGDIRDWLADSLGVIVVSIIYILLGNFNKLRTAVLGLRI